MPRRSTTLALEQVDVIVVGAGVAGLCCAGELVLSGSKTLMISETREVGFASKPHVVDGNTAVIPTCAVYMEGAASVGNLARLVLPFHPRKASEY